MPTSGSRVEFYKDKRFQFISGREHEPLVVFAHPEINLWVNLLFNNSLVHSPLRGMGLSADH
ncbi:hypothetical protein HOV93_11560 [Planctomycetes bacterium FF15]|uniref:Uncharacterized protein n=1 Tax=Bremerella alba TaxID=980252 RepID=A0A7V8V300_9BACT|nr:hypothetical protein [Bremerella alba]